MSLLTAFYNLIKPQLSDSPPDITVMNPNWDKIDTELNSHETQINTLANHACRVYHNVNQSVSSGANTVLAFNSELFDTESIHDIATNNSRLICKTAGIYYISASVSFYSNDTGMRQLAIRVNEVDYIASLQVPAVTGNSTNLTIGTLYKLAVNDYVELCAIQSSGVALDVPSSANYSPEFMMAKVG